MAPPQVSADDTRAGIRQIRPANLAGNGDQAFWTPPALSAAPSARAAGVHHQGKHCVVTHRGGQLDCDLCIAAANASHTGLAVARATTIAETQIRE